MNDNNKVKTVLYTYIVDDGWHLPYEVIEEIEYRIEEAASEAFKRVRREHYRHKGEWLTAEVAKKYAAKSWFYRVVESNQYCGKVREIGKELQDLYGVTELEAINILFEHNVSDYLNKYYRIQHMIPNNINQQDICDEVAYEYLLAITKELKMKKLNDKIAKTAQEQIILVEICNYFRRIYRKK